MNLKHKTDIGAMAQCLLLDKEKELLGSLEVGEAIVKLQGRIPRPFLIKVPEFIIRKGMVTDAVIKERMRIAACLIEIPQQPQELPVSPPSTSSKAKMATIMAALLADIRDYPESGIAARYKRLDLSVRQGQKFRLKALELALIDERAEATRTGRKTLTQLTEKGKRVLGAEANSL
jgi:hypothetical protein